jgi:plastocyanin
MLLRGPLSLVVLADVLALALSACGSGKAAETPPAVAGNDGGPTVTIQDLAYTPATLTVGVGTTVTWVWRDGTIAHDVKGDGFRSVCRGVPHDGHTRPARPDLEP